MSKSETKYPRLTYKQLLDDAVKAALAPTAKEKRQRELTDLRVEIQQLRCAVILLADYLQNHIGTNAAKEVMKHCTELVPYTPKKRGKKQ